MYKRYRQAREKIRRRIRSRVKGTDERPRLSVFRSNAHIYLQLIDDRVGRTICSASDFELKKDSKRTKKETAFEVGSLLAKKALKINKKSVVFDRSGYKYHGRVRSSADGSRQGGLFF